MPNCPNCSYELTLIERRRRYKCSKCSRLYLQKLIDEKEFREWNRGERVKDRKEIKAEYNRQNVARYQRENKEKVNAYQRKWSKTDKAKAAFKRYYEKNKKVINEKAKAKRQLNKEKISEEKAKYYDLHRDTIIGQKRAYRLGLSEQKKKEQNEKRKARRHRNIDDTRLTCRINYWKMQQRALALKTFSDDGFKAYNGDSDNVLPTSVLAEQLKVR
jgi:hypothetical protein